MRSLALLSLLLVPLSTEGQDSEVAGRRIAVDLEHGRGEARLEMRRVWAGSETTHLHFGPGWGDWNVVLLTWIDPGAVLLWRGGIPWRSAERTGDSFRLSDGGTLARSEQGWQGHAANGTAWAFDADGRRIQEGIARYVFDEQNRLTAIEKGPSNRLTYRYDGPRIDRVDGPEGLNARYEYDSKGRLVAVTHARSIRIEYRYDAEGRLDLGTPSEPAEEETSDSILVPQAELTYDEFGRVREIRYPDDRVMRVEYNALDLPTRRVHADGTVESRTYDSTGRPTRIEFSGGFWEEFEYDRAGRITVWRQAPSLTRKFRYDDRGRLLEIVDSEGRTARFTYDEAGNPLSETGASGETLRWSYDSQGRPTESLDEFGTRSAYHYDSEGRLSRVEDPVHGKRTYGYSPEGYTLEREGLGTWSFQTFHGKTIATTTPSDKTTVQEYDARERLVRATLPSGASWTYSYDSADRMVSIEGPDDARTLISYDTGGRVTAVTRGIVAWRHYRYDKLGRLERESSALGVAAEYRYDPHGKIESVRLPEGTVRYGYDASGMPVTVQGPDDRLEQAFHPDGDLARRNYFSAGMELRLPRDARGRPAGIELNRLKVAYEYDARGHVEKIRLPGGEALSLETRPEEGGVRVRIRLTPELLIERIHDSADRLTQVWLDDGGDLIPFGDLGQLDADGNLIERDSVPLKVDADDRLATAEYDLGGNITALGESRWLLDEMGRPSRQGTKRYRWDSSGNLSEIQAGEQTVTNAFDAAGRLRTRRVGGSVWKYGYLADGDRLWQEGPEGRTWYAYLPEGLAGVKDPQGVVWLLVCLPGTDLPLAACGSNGKTHFLFADRVGSIRAWLDSKGTALARTDYGPFGAVLQSEGAPPFRMFAGMVHDASGLCYARNRYYDPELARFISIDPELGSPDLPASHNPYSYALNNPFRYRDPSGMSPQEEWTWIEKLRKRPGLAPELKETLAQAERLMAEGRVKDAGELLKEVDRNAATPGRIRKPPPRPSVPRPTPGTQIAKEVAEDRGKGLFRRIVGGRIGRWLIRPIGVALDLYTIAQSVHEANQTRKARKTEQQNVSIAEEQIRVLKDHLQSTLADPNRKNWKDPSCPADFGQIVQRMHQNLNQGRRPYEGILKPPSDSAADEAIKAARGLLGTGRALAQKIHAAESQLRQHELQAQLELHRADQAIASAGARIEGSKKTPSAAQDVRRLTGELRTQTAKLEEALQGLMSASEKAKAMADRICGYAQKSRTATEKEIEAWKTEANEAIHEASADLESARKKVEAFDRPPTALESALQALEGLQAATPFGADPLSTAERALSGAQEQIQAADSLRTQKEASTLELRALAAKVDELLQKYAGRDGVEALRASAKALLAGLGSSARSTVAAKLGEASNRLNRVRARAASAVEKPDAAVADARDAISDYEAASFAGQFATQSAEAPLQKALKCLSEIKSEDQAEVPAVLGLKKDVAIRKIQDAGFSPLELPADRPPSKKEEEDTVQKQAPGAGEKLKRKGVVKIWVYRRAKGVPDVVGWKVDDAKKALAAAGLTAVSQDAGPAPTKEKSHTVKDQVPPAGKEAGPDKTVTISVFGEFVNPETDLKAEVWYGTWVGKVTYKQSRVKYESGRIDIGSFEGTTRDVSLTLSEKQNFSYLWLNYVRGWCCPGAELKGNVLRGEKSVCYEIEFRLQGHKMTGTIIGHCATPLRQVDIERGAERSTSLSHLIFELKRGKDSKK